MARKRSTVSVERLRRSDEPVQYATDDMMTTDNYFVETTRMMGDWVHTVELKGERYRIPGKVIERIITHRESIIKEGRQDRAREKQNQLKVKGVAQADQEAALADDMARDLGNDMKEAFIDVNFRDRSMDQLRLCNEFYIPKVSKFEGGKIAHERMLEYLAKEE